jgi:hypothetical protein
MSAAIRFRQFFHSRSFTPSVRLNFRRKTHERSYMPCRPSTIPRCKRRTAGVITAATAAITGSAASAGVLIAASDAIAGAVTAGTSINAATAALSGNATIGGTLGVTGMATVGDARSVAKTSLARAANRLDRRGESQNQKHFFNPLFQTTCPHFRLKAKVRFPPPPC